jgi:hypothetical protein
MRTKMNAKFWEYRVDAGAVKVVLDPGQTSTHVEGGTCDEGYSITEEAWSFDGTFVTHVRRVRGADCDGRHDSTFVSRCHVMALRAGEEDPAEPGVRYPRWQRVRESQRDYAAEAMGY